MAAGWGKNIKFDDMESSNEESTSKKIEKTTKALGGRSKWGSNMVVEDDDEESLNIGSVEISFTTSISSYLEVNGRSYPSAKGQPLIVKRTGGTKSQFYVSIGADVVNPNHDLLAEGVTIEITYTNATGDIVDVSREYIRYVDPGATIHFATEHYIDDNTFSNFAVNVYASEFYKVDRSFMSKCSLENVSTREDSWGNADIFGMLKNNSDDTIEGCTGYIQFLDNSEQILGGVNCYVDMVPAHQQRPIKTNCSVKLNASKYITSVVFDI